MSAPQRIQSAEPARWLWHEGFYDGPLDGYAQDADGVHYWVSVAPDTEDRRHRVYEYRELTRDEFEIAEARHQVWRDMVGHHCDYVYDEHGRRSRPERFAAPVGWMDYYSLDLPRPDFSDKPVVHAFSSSPHNRRARSRRYWQRVNAAESWRANRGSSGECENTP